MVQCCAQNLRHSRIPLTRKREKGEKEKPTRYNINSGERAGKNPQHSPASDKLTEAKQMLQRIAEPRDD